MSRQDADDEDSSPETGDGQAAREESDGAESQTAGTPEASEREAESLEEIAEKPDADVAEVLEELTDTESSGESSDDELTEFVEEQSAETVADVIAALRTERAELSEQLAAERERAEDLQSRLSRKQADFQNYKKRQQERMEEEKQRATEDLVERLLDVRDNLTRALEQDDDADIRGGIESTLVQFNEELDRENVEVIEPDLGSDVDPQRHEVLMTVESDQPEDTVAQLHRPGYEMAGKVLRPAQVAVSDGSGADGENADADAE